MSMSCARAAESLAAAAASERAPVEPVSWAAAPCHGIVAVFNSEFAPSEHTVLCGGASEPLYEPSRAGPDGSLSPARIHFREDFPSSALHEIAHWCIAGRKRRRLVDYGYWYAPDGRDARQQRAFLEVEVRPQALEWCFSQAACQSFRLSLDNLDAPPDAACLRRFAAAVVAHAEQLRVQGLPPRGE